MKTVFSALVLSMVLNCVPLSANFTNWVEDFSRFSYKAKKAGRGRVQKKSPLQRYRPLKPKVYYSGEFSWVT